MFVCYYHYICVYFTYISQLVETYLWCAGIYNNHVIADCSQRVPVKEF